MNHEKTFAAIKKLQEIEIELHRLKNALEMANKREWVGLTLEEILDTYRGPDGSDYVEYARGLETKLKEKNT